VPAQVLRPGDCAFVEMKKCYLLINGVLDEEEKDELEKTFKNRKAGKKFKRIIEKNSKGFFKGEIIKPSTLKF
jgi:hypothetical protein